MGALLKYVILFTLFALGAVAFQNCGHKLQANGDPYENRINTDDPFLDPPNGGANSGQIAGNFAPELTCAPATSGGPIAVAQLGTKDGVDAVYVQLSDGRYKIYPWPNEANVLELNDAISTSVTIGTVQLSGNQLQLQVVVGGAASAAVLNCQ